MWPRQENKQEDGFLDMAIRGDRVGLEYLVRTYQNLAYTIAVRILSNSEDAEEVVQDSFMKAFASLSKFKRASKFSTWLFRIVYNTAVTRLNSRKMVTVHIDERISEDQFQVLENGEFDLLEGEERKKYVRKALDRLNEQDRLVITLHYIGEKTVREICDILGKEKSAVKMRLMRGRRQLEIALGSLLKNEIQDLL